MKKTLFILCAAVATLVACNKAEVATPDNKVDRVVKFQAENLYAFETKAMTGSVGIWAGDPINVSNAEYTISGTSLNGGSILWGIEQAGTNTASHFFSVYPYASGRTFVHETGLSYAINTSTGPLKTVDIDYALNFMVAGATVAPGDGAIANSVDFNYKHPFSKLVYKITNNSGDAIKFATIGGVYWNGKIDYTLSEGSINDVVATRTGDPTVGTIGDGQSVTGNAYMNGGDVEDGKNVFYTITMPGSITPVLTIQMWSGATYTFNLSTATFTAVAGKVYTANIELSNTHTATTNQRNVGLAFSETDWDTTEEDKTTSAAGTTSETYWCSINASSYDGSTFDDFSTKVPMTCEGDHLWRATITFAADATDTDRKFKLRINDNWVGQTEKTADDNSWSVWTVVENGGNDIANSFKASTTYTIYFKNYGDTKQCYVKEGNNTIAYNNDTHAFVF